MPALQTAREYREEVRNIALRMRELVDNPAGEDGDLSSEQLGEFDRIHARQEELRGKIEQIEAREQQRRQRQERLSDVEGYLQESRGLQAGDQDTRDLDNDPEDRRQEHGADDYRRAFDAYLRFGMSSLTPQARSMLLEQRGEIDTRSMNLPEELRDMVTAKDTAGGFFVPEGFMNTIVEAQKQFGGMRRARTTVINTNSGQDLPIPTDDDTSNKGHILSEGKTETTQDVSLGQVVLHAYMYSSRIVKVSRQLLQDSAFNVQSYLSRKLGERLGRITNEHFSTGDGAAKPYGVTTQAASALTAAAATDIEFDELTDLKHAVDPSYRDMAQWMFNDDTLKTLKKKKDGDGRPLWQSGVAIGEPNTIDGDPYVVNQELPSLTSGAKAVAYGDFSLYYIRDVMGMQLLRLDERYADSLHVAFLAFSRHDGVLVDAGQNPIQVITQG